MGILLKRNLIDIKLLDDLLTNSVNRHWNGLGMGQTLTAWRNRIENRREATKWRHDPEYSWDESAKTMTIAFHGFNYLYRSLTEYRKTHPREFT